jgi:hypothetical protein
MTISAPKSTRSARIRAHTLYPTADVEIDGTQPVSSTEAEGTH